MADDPEALTRLLSEAGAGNPEAAREVIPLVYAQLRRSAQKQLAGERSDHSLQATELVHEAYLRLQRSAPVAWESRAHFYVAAAEAMRRILIEHARKRSRRKHGGGLQRIPLNAAELVDSADPEEIVSVDQAIRRIEKRDPRLARIVRLRFFVGLGTEEIAELLRVSDRTVRRDWNFARAWLYRELGGKDEQEKRHE
jgi:RNA polymerase sigma factor (TIGR02999 family)